MPLLVIFLIIIIAAVMGYAQGLDAKTRGYLQECQKKYNVYRCEVIAVPVKEKQSEPR